MLFARLLLEDVPASDFLGRLHLLGEVIPVLVQYYCSLRLYFSILFSKHLSVSNFD